MMHDDFKAQTVTCNQLKDILSKDYINTTSQHQLAKSVRKGATNETTMTTGSVNSMSLR